MKYKSFASRLSREIAIITSVIFIFAIATIAVRGSKMTKDGAIDYVAEVARTSTIDIQSFLNTTEASCNTFGRAIEECYHCNAQLDTANFYDLMERTLLENSNILGIGVYYEPYKYLRKEKYAGIYVGYDSTSGQYVREWQDDAQTAIDGYDYFTADWYADVVSSGESIWMKPFMDYLETGDKTERYMTSYSVPLKDNKGNIFGVCVIDIALDWLYDKLQAMNPYDHSNIAIFDSDYDIVCNPISDNPFEGSLLDSPFIKGMEDITYEGDGKNGDWVWKAYEDVMTIDIRDGRDMAFCVTKTMDNGWTVLITTLYREAFEAMLKIWQIISLIALFGILTIYFLSRIIIRTEAKPLVEFAGAASKITDGKFDVPIPEVSHNDEVGELGRALSYMQTSVTKYIEDLKRETSEKERLAGELDVARKIQMEMLSRQFPKHEHTAIYADCIPAKEVGGDLYDFCMDGNYFNFILGDVSGKGVPAALLMAISIAAFRATVKERHSMSEIVGLINDTFCKSNDDMMFVTLVVGRINTRTGEMELCNAGHNPMVMISSDGKAKYLKLKTNVVCGVMPGFSYQEDHATLDKGSRLVVYSDGITEAENVMKDQYGEDRLIAWASSHGTKSVYSDEEVIDSLIRDVHNFTSGAEQNDDMTAMSISLNS